MRPAVQIYDEDETLLDLDSVTKDKTIVGLLCFSLIRAPKRSSNLLPWASLGRPFVCQNRTWEPLGT